MNKRIAVSVGLVAMGTSAVHALAAEAPKPWSATVALRAFYDDNYTTAQTDKQESFGFEVNPAIALNLALEQTIIVGSYAYSLDWYDARSQQGLESYDQSHNFNVDVTHTFSERLTGSVGDNFVVAQEPRLLDPSLATAQRANGDNIRNTGYLSLTGVLTPLMSGTITYNNTLIDYVQKGAQLTAGGAVTNASRSGLLDRVDQSFSAQLGMHVSPTLTAFVAYSFDATCYTGDEPIAVNPLTGANFMSSARNSYMHRGSVGVDYAATEVLSASASVGLQYSDFYNDPAHTTSVSPYADASLTYAYTTGSSLNFGFSHSRNATDVVQPTSDGHITTDQESSAAHLSIVHQITPMLTASCNANAQASTFRDGFNDGKTDWVYTLNLTLNYALTEHFGIVTGYEYDKVDSDLAGRSFDRNRFNIGVSAKY